MTFHSDGLVIGNTDAQNLCGLFVTMSCKDSSVSKDMASAHSQHNPGSEDFRSPNPNSMQGFQQCSQSPRLTGQGTAGGSFLGTPRQSVPGTDAAAHAGL